MVNMVSTADMVITRSMRPMNKVDFHTHILPCIDDGSQSESQSYRMLEMEKKNGVAVVIATPHFYPDGPTPSEFVQERKASYERLIAFAQEHGDDLPVIKLGAEVLLCTETADLEDLKVLAIEGTDYILIEMPYDNWQEWVYESIERIQVKHKLIPVIAHVERYIPMQKDTDQIYRLLSMPGVLGQMNTRSLLYRESSRLCHKLIENNFVHVLGSDAHRGQHLVDVHKSLSYIEKKHGSAVLGRFCEQGERIMQNQPILKESPIPFKRILRHFYK